MNRMVPWRPSRILLAALLASGACGLAVACGSDDGGGGGGGACIGLGCDAGLSEGAARTDADAPDSPSVVDGGLDAALDADAAIPTYTGKHLWSKLFGSNENSAVQGGVVATDSAGNVYLAGTLTGDADFGGGILTGANADVYIAKFNKDGNHLWSKKFGDSDVQGAGHIAVDAAGSVFVGGNFNGTIDFGGGPLTSAGGYDIFVAKLDANGNHVWSKAFGDPTYQSLGGLALVGADVVLIGEKSGSVDFGGGALTGRNYLVKLAGSNGAHVWSKQSTSGGGFVPRSLAADATGKLVGAGSLGSTLDWGGGVLTSAGQDDVLVIKFDATGNTLWSKRFGDAQPQDAWAVAIDASGNVVLTGRVQGALDFGVGAMNPSQATIYAAKLDPNGAGVWSKAFPAISGALPFSNALGMDAFGNIAIGGSTDEAMDLGGGPLPCTSGTTNIFIGKLDGSGKHLWSKGWAAGAGGMDGSMDVAFDASGNMLFAGSLHQSTIDMGGGPLASIGGGGFLALAKFAP